MSRQINFWTDPEDAVALQTWLLNEFTDAQVIRCSHGSVAELTPVSADGNLDGTERMYLVPSWAYGRVQLATGDDVVFCVNGVRSPVIQYLPSRFEEATNKVYVGRVYWCYTGELPADALRQVDRMFRWIRAHSIPVPQDKKFRVFEHVARNQRMLADRWRSLWISPPWPTE